MPGARRGRIAVSVAALALTVATIGAVAVDPASAPAASVAPPATAPAAASTRTSVYRIAFFGDSVSVGFGASARSRTYVARVSRWLERHGRRVIRMLHAKGGVPVAYWQDASMPTQLDAAVVELGTNDVRLGTPAARFAQQYRTLMSRIRAANPKVRLLCLSVWSHPAAASLDAVVNAQIRALCPRGYVEITTLRDRRHIRSDDGFHPNDTGYRLIAQAVESKLKTG